MHTRFWLVNVKQRDHLGDLYVDGRTILKCTLQNSVCEDVWTAFA
jgi:hypothetical protein